MRRAFATYLGCRYQVLNVVQVLGRHQRSDMEDDLVAERRKIRRRRSCDARHQATQVARVLLDLDLPADRLNKVVVITRALRVAENLDLRRLTRSNVQHSH